VNAAAATPRSPLPHKLLARHHLRLAGEDIASGLPRHRELRLAINGCWTTKKTRLALLLTVSLAAAQAITPSASSIRQPRRLVGGVVCHLYGSTRATPTTRFPPMPVFIPLGGGSGCAPLGAVSHDDWRPAPR
jgi:hypothetical protein